MPRASAALLAALLLTALNAAKPLVIDDPVYVAFARQAAQHPTDPYGFEFFWYEEPEPAMRFGTVPSVIPYWLAGAMTLLGDHPIGWKLSLFPFALALTGSLAFLLRRFAKPFATPVIFAIALGPTILPGFNLMLDVPAFALGLLAYALFVLACERRDARIALAAGLALGLAMQTKYSAVVYPLLVLAHAAIYRRPREGAVALVVATGLFVGWESLLFARYEQSHFLSGLERLRSIEVLPALTQAASEAPGSVPFYWILCLLSSLGGTLLFPGLLAGVGLGAKRFQVAVAALVASAAFGAIAVLPRPPLFAGEGFFGRLAAGNPELFVFVPLGLLVAIGVASVAMRLLRGSAARDPRPDRVLVVWLLLEIGGFFVISPYPAVRRVIGLGVAAAVLASRAASLREDAREVSTGVRIATAFGLALGLLYFGSDLADALARRGLVERAAQSFPQLGARNEHESRWYIGHWEVQFYAERAGMHPVVAGESRLQAHDWLLLPNDAPRQPVSLPAGYFRQEALLAATSASPWSTISAYYDGPVPLRRQPEIHASVRILRVSRDLVPWLQGSPSAQPPGT